MMNLFELRSILTLTSPGPADRSFLDILSRMIELFDTYNGDGEQRAVDISSKFAMEILIRTKPGI